MYHYDIVLSFLFCIIIRHPHRYGEFLCTAQKVPVTRSPYAVVYQALALFLVIYFVVYQTHSLSFQHYVFF